MGIYLWYVRAAYKAQVMQVCSADMCYASGCLQDLAWLLRQKRCRSAPDSACEDVEFFQAWAWGHSISFQPAVTQSSCRECPCAPYFTLLLRRR